MNVGLLACITLSALVSVAQAAPEPADASEPLRLTAPQMDTATAGTASLWITSAASGIGLGGSNGFSHTASTLPYSAGLCCGSNANIQFVFKVNGLPNLPLNSSGRIASSPEGTTISFGETILERNIQIR